ncbi:MAG: 16S rRNA (cytosine(1402)-N(4))-methyltransferase RsmH [Oscillibacter sp.]|jgi:16S rRNA (cytosine1402-N4)-methyltransferase|nr:16S rRNA (cytosine(1402)-N(4))-methyltransferase RsmH [Oscillibacter sp.]
MEQQHKRRVRYQGTHPRTYQEKYKELNPERYGDDVKKILEHGKTPAGMHVPIMVHEILEVLQIQPGEVGLDATLGYGGHTQEMLKCLQGQGHLYATDVDPIESVKTEKRLAELGFGPEILTVRHMNFADVDKVALHGEKFDFVLADLGVSSMQIDNPSRGFSFKFDGPLDLRLNPETGVTAAQRLCELSREEFSELLVENSDEPYADEIAKEVASIFRRGGEIATTKALTQAVTEALAFLPEKERKDAIKKSCQRVFQALRIDVNSEFEVLYTFLDKLPGVLVPGGRVAVLTFHSGEDRLVKKAFQQFYRDGVYSDIAKDVTRPSGEECFRNPRAHSTKLRWAVRGER